MRRLLFWALACLWIWICWLVGMVDKCDCYFIMFTNDLDRSPHHHPVKYFAIKGPPWLRSNMNSPYPITLGHTPFTLQCVRMFCSSQVVYSGKSVLILDLLSAEELCLCLESVLRSFIVFLLWVPPITGSQRNMLMVGIHLYSIVV